MDFTTLNHGKINFGGINQNRLQRSQSVLDRPRHMFSRQNSILKMAPLLPFEKAKHLAVKAENICLTYGEGENVNYVLNGVCLNVPKGHIYGLLGPSGCGKTSLLKIICGLLQPEYGDVRLFGYLPGTNGSGVPGPGIGYMPQEIALQSDLTIEEMLTYYGRLALMSEKEISRRCRELITLLELPPANRLIANLSGGQQRRVSLAVTVIHRPRLVILDEPTVGVDPLLCQKIWEQLINFATKDEMTIIITTHYIEETKRANLVGFMRKGQILSEGNPEKLIEHYNATGLEHVFYQLCLNQKHRKGAVEALDSDRKMSIIQPDNNLSKGGFLRTSVNRYKSKPSLLSRQGSFTAGFGELQHQLLMNKTTAHTEQNLNDAETDQFNSVYSTPLQSPKLKSLINNDFEPTSSKAEIEKLPEKIVVKSIKKPSILYDYSQLQVKLEPYEPSYHSNDFFNWFWRIFAMSWKLQTQTLRQPMFLALLYIAPTLIIAFLFFCIGHTPNHVPVGFLNEEVKDHRHRYPGFPRVPCDPKHKNLDYDELFKMYSDTGISNRTKTGDYDFDYTENVEGIGVFDRLRVPYIPDLLLKHVNTKIIDFKYGFKSEKEAREAVRNRSIWGFVHLKPEFSRSFFERDLMIKTKNDRNITNEVIDQGTIHLIGDVSDKFMESTVRISMQDAYLEMIRELGPLCALDPRTLKIPVEIGGFIYGEFIKGDFFGVRDFAAPGFIMSITYALAMGLCTMQTLLELQDKMFVRNFSAGLSAGQMLIANILGRFFLMFGSIVVMLIFSVTMFQIPIHGSVLNALNILMLQTLVGMCNGLFFTTCISDITTCLFVTLGCLIAIVAISGVFWPLEALPYYLRWFSRALPFTVPGESFRSILIRKGAPSILVMPGVLMSVLWLIIFSLLSLSSFRRMKFL